MIRTVRFQILALAFLATFHFPSRLIGTWKVGKPYDVGQPIGLDGKQEQRIIGLDIRFSPDRIGVCGKQVSIKSIDMKRLTSKDFLAKYGFTPNVIGLRGRSVVDININHLHSTKACGEYADPGSHLFVSNGHVVMEINNDYFPLKKG